MDQGEEEDVGALLTSNCRKITEIVIVGCVCGIIFGCLCVPIIHYVTGNDVSSLTELGFDEIDVDNCSQQPTISGSNVLSRYNGACSHYDGMCSTYLNLLLTNTNSTLITMSNSDVQEEQIMPFVGLLTSGLASEECFTAVLPFVCQYVYPPCDGDGNPLLVTEEECVNIRDDVCATEWRLAMSTDLRLLLPVCEEFRGENISNSIITMTNVSEPLICHYQFGDFCGVCLPLCGEFSQYRVHTKLAGRTIIIFSCVLELIGGSIILVASIIRRKEMLVYPQVLEVCHVIGAMILAAVAFIGYVGGQERLFCSHRTVHLSFLEPSVYTQIMGFVSQFCYLYMAITWFLYVLHLFLGLAFPFWSAKHFGEEKRKKRICVVEIIGSVIFSGTLPTIVLSMSGYRLARFPPIIVVPSRDLALYTLLVPLAILLIVGVNLTFLSFWIIHKTSGIFNKEKGKGICSIRFSVPQVKILLLLSYVMVFAIMALATLTVIANNADGLITEVFRYSVCNLSGYDPKCEEIRDEFDKHSSPGLTNATIILLGFLSWVHLLFVIQANHIQRAAKWIKTYKITLLSSKTGSGLETEKNLANDII